jgi:hypothetical protein
MKRKKRMTESETARVINATVHLDGKGGQGVLVAGGFILTAAHCIQWNGDGGMTMGEYYLEHVTTKSGAHFRVGPHAAEPVSDIAVLGSLDDQEFCDDCDEFEQWCEATPAVPIAYTTPAFRDPLRVSILTHKGKWIDARIVRYVPPGRPLHGVLYIEADDRIEGGASGGPVVDSSGQLVGVVSHFSESAVDGKYIGRLPIVHLALPQWACAAISESEDMEEERQRLALAPR